MTTSVFVSTFEPILKNDGTVNALGTIEFYEPGQSGSTAKIVYSDYALTTSLGATITLDSAATKVVYLDGDYDCIIKDSAGATIRSRSNINPPQSTTSIAPNIISNGSFETNTSNVPTEWTLTEWNVGANVVDSSTGNFAHGAYSMKFVSNGSGGGSLTTNSFFPVSESTYYQIDFYLKSTIDVRNIVQFLWYDESQVALGTPSTSVYDEAAANPTTWTHLSYSVTPPSGARFAKIKIIGCDSSDGTSGTARFDGVIVTETQKTLKLAGNLTIEGTSTLDVTVLTDVLKKKQSANIASAATVDLSTATGNYVVVTHSSGTTSITSFGTVQAGTEFWIKFNISGGTLNLTYNATSMIICGAASIAPITDGATMKVLALGSGNWQVLSYKYGATWQNVLGSRSLATAYQNTTGQDIMVSASSDNNGAGGPVNLYIHTSTDNFGANNITLGIQGNQGASQYGVTSATIPHGTYYKVENTSTIDYWAELR